MDSTPLSLKNPDLWKQYEDKNAKCEYGEPIQEYARCWMRNMSADLGAKIDAAFVEKHRPKDMHISGAQHDCAVVAISEVWFNGEQFYKVIQEANDAAVEAAMQDTQPDKPVGHKE